MKVKYLDHMGSDLTAVNAARVSFGKTSTELTKADQHLIGYLARGCRSGEWDDLITSLTGRTREDLGEILQHVKKMPTHWTPFGHPQVSLHFRIPMFVANQLKRHTVGFVINEESRRYVDNAPEFYEPPVWRKRAEDVKQGSSDEGVSDDLQVPHQYNTLLQQSFDTYNRLLDQGVAPEMARMVLPQSMYVEFWMTGSLYGWANMYVQRIDPHAQWEIQQVAKQIGEIVEPLFPVSWKELVK